YEYWASGTAVVSSRLAGIAEVGADGDNIRFCAPSDPKDLAAKLVELLTDARLRERIREGGVRSVGLYLLDDLSPQSVAFCLSERAEAAVVCLAPAANE